MTTDDVAVLPEADSRRSSAKLLGVRTAVAAVTDVLSAAATRAGITPGVRSRT
jgi:hypothetical protein